MLLGHTEAHLWKGRGIEVIHVARSPGQWTQPTLHAIKRRLAPAKEPPGQGSSHTHPAPSASQWCGLCTAPARQLLPRLLRLLLLLPLLPMLLLLPVRHKLHGVCTLAAAPPPRDRHCGLACGARVVGCRRAPEAWEVVGTLLLQPLPAADLLW